MNRRYQTPKHLAPLVAELERSWTQEVRVTGCAPPRHAKTETLLAFIALTLRRYPEKTIAYVTNSDPLARSKSRKARTLARQAGVVLARDAQRQNEWRTPQGGGLIATSISGQLTGQTVDIIIIDDPYKNRLQAESGAYRRTLNDWMDDVAESRLEPGSSCFIFHTRWTTDDLIAHVRTTEAGDMWKDITLPAISEDGKPLWAERFPLAWLLKKRATVGAHTWASLYQGQPRPRGGRVFNDVRLVDSVPDGCRIAIGLDLAYSGKKKGDWSVAVVLGEKGGLFYVLDVIRKQERAPVFRRRLQLLQTAWPGVTMRWYVSGTEIGTADFIGGNEDDSKSAQPVNLEILPAKGDKFQRAIPVAAAWNGMPEETGMPATEGRIFVPRNAPWANAFVTVVSNFTGDDGEPDDDVDALGAAFDKLNEKEFTIPIPTLDLGEATENPWRF